MRNCWMGFRSAQRLNRDFLSRVEERRFFVLLGEEPSKLDHLLLDNYFESDAMA